MECLHTIYESQTKTIKKLYEQSFGKALEYVNLQIENYGDFARGLLLYLIEITSEKELDQIVLMYKNTCFMQQLKSIFNRIKDSVYQQKYDELVDKIIEIVDKSTMREHDNELLSISKFISEGNAEKVRELLEQGESPHSLVQNMPIKEYAQQYSNQQVIEVINKYIDNETAKNDEDGILSLPEIVERLNSTKYTDIEKLSLILKIGTNKTKSETDYMTSIKDDKLVSVIQSLYYQKNRQLINQFIESKRFRLAFELSNRSLADQEIYFCNKFAYDVMKAKIAITSKDLKELLDITGRVRRDGIEMLRKVEEGNLEDIKSFSLCTKVYVKITIGQLIGRLADLETIKTISVDRSAEEISELLLGAIFLDKKESFDYLISLPKELTAQTINLYYILENQKFNYLEALAHRYPKLKIEHKLIEDEQIPGFWTYTKDFSITHPIFSLVGTAMASLVADVPSERVSMIIDNLTNPEHITRLFDISKKNQRFDIAVILLQKHGFLKKRDNYVDDMIKDWTGSDDQKCFFKCICRNLEYRESNIYNYLEKAAYLDDPYPLEILIGEQAVREYISKNEIECVLSFINFKFIDSVQNRFKKEVWIIGAASPNVFKERFTNLPKIQQSNKVLMAMMAILHNQHENLKFLLSNGLDPNSKGISPGKSINDNISFINKKPPKKVVTEMDESLLIFTVLRGDFESFNILINAGADRNTRNNRSKSILLVSLKAGRQDIFEYLLNNGVKIEGKDLNALLLVSCLNGYMSYAKYFIDLGASPKEEYYLNSAIKGHHIEIVKMLLKSKCRPTLSALKAACKANCAPIIDLLFEYGLKVERYEEYWNSAEEVEALVRHGVKIYISNEYFGSIFFPWQNFINRTTMYLISNGTDLSKIAYQILYRNSKYVPSFIISVMLDSGVNVNFSSDGKSLLSKACANGNLDVVKLLIERGSDIEMPSMFKIDIYHQIDGPPLLFACNANNNREVVSYLLEKGANPEPDSAASEVMYYAAKNNYMDLLIPRYTGKVNWNPSLLADVVSFTYNNKDVDSAVKIVELFLKKVYEEKDRLKICALANGRNDDICFDFVRRIIAKGFSFKGFDVNRCSSPDVAALCLEAGGSSCLCPKRGILRMATAMCVDVNSISNTEGNMFFIRGLPEDQQKQVFVTENQMTRRMRMTTLQL